MRLWCMNLQVHIQQSLGFARLPEILTRFKVVGLAYEREMQDFLDPWTGLAISRMTGRSASTIEFAPDRENDYLFAITRQFDSTYVFAVKGRVPFRANTVDELIRYINLFMASHI